MTERNWRINRDIEIQKEYDRRMSKGEDSRSIIKDLAIRYNKNYWYMRTIIYTPVTQKPKQ